MPQSQLTQNKEILRKKCKEIRLKLYKEGHLKKISDEITKKISSSEVFMSAKSVMLFYPKKYEIDVLALLDFNKGFYLPRCEDKNLAICEYKKDDILKKSEFGVYEPVNESINDLSILDLIVVPALCADKNGNRLGYGGGFYDRFLKNKNLRAKTVVVVPKCLLFEDIGKEEFDIQCDEVVFA